MILPAREPRAGAEQGVPELDYLVLKHDRVYEGKPYVEEF
jgi:hypothetical protein